MIQQNGHWSIITTFQQTDFLVSADEKLVKEVPTRMEAGSVGDP
jgi:hypothetical protein